MGSQEERPTQTSENLERERKKSLRERERENRILTGEQTSLVAYILAFWAKYQKRTRKNDNIFKLRKKKNY